MDAYKGGDAISKNSEQEEGEEAGFTAIKVPTSHKTNRLLYIKRMDSADKEATLPSWKSVGKARKPQSALTLKLGNLKSGQEGDLRRSSRLLTNGSSDALPEKLLARHRSLLVASFDQEFTEEEVKRIFSLKGHVRKVVSLNMNIQSSKKSANSLKVFAVEYKSAASIALCFDAETFYQELLKKSSTAFKRLQSDEKAQVEARYLNSLGDLYLKQPIAGQSELEVLSKRGFWQEFVPKKRKKKVNISDYYS